MKFFIYYLYFKSIKRYIGTYLHNIYIEYYESYQSFELL